MMTDAMQQLMDLAVTYWNAVPTESKRSTDWISEDGLRAVAARARAEALEEAARVCESQITGSDYHHLAVHGRWDHMAQAATNCAAAIRARAAEGGERG